MQSCLLVFEFCLINKPNNKTDDQNNAPDSILTIRQQYDKIYYLLACCFFLFRVILVSYIYDADDHHIVEGI